jgi:hypothetical protein
MSDEKLESGIKLTEGYTQGYVQITCRIGNSSMWTETIPREHYDFIISQERQRIKEWVEKLQKQCSEADGMIDGVTALHEVLNFLNK